MNSLALPGHAGTLAVRHWPNSSARFLVVLSHGYGEHLGRYGPLAEALCAAGAAVVGADHVGHGESEGERVLIEDFEPVVDDVRRVAQWAGTEYPGLPLVLLGHSLGGMIAARYAQRFPEDLTALVLSSPVLGTWQAVDQLEYDEIPDEPIDVSTLSRDPAVGQAYTQDPLVWHGPFKRATLEAIDRCLTTIDFDHPLGDALPCLWVHGDEDELVPIAETRTGMDRIRGLAFTERIYPGGRHELFNETNAEEVRADLIGFLTRLLG
ncbi:alpha/beta fold hydrolase [Sciscionella sediminilitoris]|uniref:alpha/beta fold hydrolase n=1 Tax=Sciscionella sediminilitoris TaxID=1445613 RepID=UPI0004DED0E7|nr:alpha/beta fold hydrolase [Sciscionella sp. SE31]